jgi:hypothetical protein
VRNNWKNSEQLGGYRELVGSRVRVIGKRGQVRCGTIVGRFFKNGKVKGWYVRIDGHKSFRPYDESNVLPEEESPE